MEKWKEKPFVKKNEFFQNSKNYAKGFQLFFKKKL